MDKNEDKVTKTFTFPMRVWIDFENEAKKNYGDCYWLAIKSMLVHSKVFESIDLLKLDIKNLYEELEQLKEEKGNALSEVEEAEDINEGLATLGGD